jgi:hypothetical protein
MRYSSYISTSSEDHRRLSRRLVRYLSEARRGLRDIARVTASLAGREHEWRVREGLV